jgi:very-short-patch-repair endonuclease
MTDAERRLWRELRLRKIGGRFRRQHPIGGYIADFACLEAWLVVEIDGGQHAEAVEADGVRTSALEAEGFRVFRFWNNEVFENIEGVVQRIAEALVAHPHPGLVCCKLLLSVPARPSASEPALAAFVGKS